MRKYGLIGYPLSHSFSAEYFTAKFRRESIDAVYKNYPLDNIDLFPYLVRDKGPFNGLNVTIPYKESVIRFLDRLNPVAEAIGAVNLVHFSEENGEQVLFFSLIPLFSYFLQGASLNYSFKNRFRI